METMYFNGRNFDQIKEFAGDACELRPVFDNGVVCGQCAYIKTTDGRCIKLMSDDVVIKDVNGFHVLGE